MPIVNCPTCKGEGSVKNGARCRTCRGTGEVVDISEMKKRKRKDKVR